jgi:group I intron endonuclease
MNSLYKTKGIYAITNKITGMAYIGQTSNNFGDRRDSNLAKLRHNKHDNLYLQEDWNNYGELNYEFKVLECLEDCSNIDEREKFWISEYRKNNKAFNMQSGGKGFPGMHLSEEAKRKIGEQNKIHGLGRKASQETKQKMSISHKGFKHTLESIEKIKIAATGRKASDETKLKCSISHSGEKSRLAKYTKEQILKAREIYDSGCNDYKYISSMTGIKYGAINVIVKRKRWKYI